MSNIPFVYQSLIDLLDKGKSSPICQNCCPCNNVYAFASVETFLKFAEALGWTQSTALCPQSKDWYVSCCTEDCFDKLSAKYGSAVTDAILDKGMVEYSLLSERSMLCEIYDSLILNNVDNAEDAAEIITSILNIGIVFSCNSSQSDQTYGSVETWLKYAEAVGLTCGSGGEDDPCKCYPEEKCCLSIRASVETYLKFAEAVE